MSLREEARKARNVFCGRKYRIDKTRPLEDQLSYALYLLDRAGGRELDLGSEDDEEDDEMGPMKYMDELLWLCEVRCELGEYKLAGANFLQCYFVAHTLYKASPPRRRDRCVFPIAHSWLTAWMEVDNYILLCFAHETACLLLEMEGCPSYIKEDADEMEKLTRR